MWICQNCNITSILRNHLQNETLRAELSKAIDKASNLEMEVGSVSSTLSELQMENERLEQSLMTIIHHWQTSSKR
jgi:hypothetical protein